MPLSLNGARHNYVQGGSGRQLLPLLQLHSPPLPFLLQEVWLLMQSWHNFSAWMLTLTLSMMSYVKWTPVSTVLPDSRLALVVLWSLPLLLPRHLRMTRHLRTIMTPTTMMMIRMEMLVVPVLTRCLLDTLTLCNSWQKGKVVLDMKVVTLIKGGLV